MTTPASPLIHPVILSGGSGTRLWPVSRRAHPKQLLALAGPRTLLQDTALRVHDPAAFAPPLVLCNDEHRFVIAEQLREVGLTPAGIVLEPAPRNTAPAIAVAALLVAAREPEATLLVLPSDHVIRDAGAFREAVARADAAAREGHLTTFGIVPERAETGFGYIRRGAPHASIEGVHAIAEFVEKPGLERATRFVASGGYAWNSGMFVFPVARLLEELERLQPELVACCRRAIEEATRDLTFTRLAAEPFAASPSISIDHALMEHTRHAAVVTAEIGWSDVGSWTALWEIAEHDARGNVTIGDVVLQDVDGCYVRAEKRLVTAIGVRDLVVVETTDAVLIAPLERSQEVKDVVARLEREGRPETTLHARVYRPWGHYEGIAEGERFQVKRISVKPGGKLSLQMHHHRAEHWVVVEGTARITNGDQETLLAENQSTYIPIGAAHRLENPGRTDLTLIEVQSGAYLGEDDIVRFEDIYGRKGSTR
jgi:mannose-1-phosphate guanylyltransferase/mannose-6-phosphate isomerase